MTPPIDTGSVHHVRLTVSDVDRVGRSTPTYSALRTAWICRRGFS